jgi:hypothetical protein
MTTTASSITFLYSKMSDLDDLSTSSTTTSDSDDDESSISSSILHDDDSEYDERNRHLFRPTKSPKTKYCLLNWDAHVAVKVRNGTFKSRYRMRHETFSKLVNILGITVNEGQSVRSTSGNSPIFPEFVVGMSLRYLAGGTKTDAADIFGVSDSLVDKLPAETKSSATSPQMG